MIEATELTELCTISQAATSVAEKGAENLFQSVLSAKRSAARGCLGKYPELRKMPFSSNLLMQPDGLPAHHDDDAHGHNSAKD